GATVPKGTAVNIVAATGTVTIVDVTGWTVDDPKSAFGELKLTVTVQDDASCPAENPRTVRSQSIAPGEAPIHSTITLTSCSGS
ncbi:MAG: serine/threonine protein kinase, partial [Microbacterium sp.]|nr:serine/threonine protein kinase [Microbacterium sp.]